VWYSFLGFLVPLSFSWSFLGMVSPSSSPVFGVFWFLLASFPLWVFLGVLVLSFLRFRLVGSRSCVRSWLFRRFGSFLLGPLRSIFSLSLVGVCFVSFLLFLGLLECLRWFSFLLFGSVSLDRCRYSPFPCRLSESPVSVVTFLLLSYCFVDALLPPLRLVRFLLSSCSSWNGFPSESRCTVGVLRTFLFLPCG
jgi:hypothetical protein